jgi:hypothetical protein
MKEKIKHCKMLMKVGPVYPGILDFEEGDDRVLTATFQCLKTTSPIGPDHNIANPQECKFGRSCYKDI